MNVATAAQWKKFERDRAHLDKIHGCAPGAWTARVSSPDFEATHVGASTWTCDACRPLVMPIFDACFGGHVVVFPPQAAS